MNKYILRGLCFTILFCMVFSVLQEVLHYRWSESEALYTKNINYSNAKPETIDVICFGTSEIYAAYDPIITYDEEGITGYNFATSWKSAITAYYQMLYALEYQSPKIVMMDFSSLFFDGMPKDSEPLFRKVVDCMPDKDLKEQMIREICTIDKSQSYLSWKFPMLRYHSMWSELSRENFEPDYQYDENYPVYQKGSQLCNSPYTGAIDEITPELWDYSGKSIDTDISEISIRYYDMMIGECQNRGIHVVAVFPPKITIASIQAAQWEAMEDYFKSRGVDYLNYNTYEEVKRLNLSYKNDYYDEGHLNVEGSVKFSKALAHDLKEKYDLKDHRGEADYVEEWDNAVKLFHNSFASDWGSGSN